MIDTESLNENQKQAVLCDDQHMRVIAGAGSGKTRVLTMRIAHLIEDEDVRETRILAITFTNKAANEMKERIRKMLPDRLYEPWISTIHSLCVRILREDIMTMGYPRNFTIMDAEDQKSVLKEAYKQLNIDASSYSYGSMLDYISNNKTADISVERAKDLAGGFYDEAVKAKVYEYYIRRQEALFALDFDDLILWTVRMFKRFDEVLNKWQRRFEYILVDEFQDIDAVQYKLITLLTGSQNSLYVVGDPDQTIYTWRGADVNIIMNFTKDYPDAKTIILNENYRSTEAILNGANSVIKNNRHRVKKDLYTNRKSDEKITHYASASDEYQAAWIAQKISDMHRKGKSYRDIAILYRSNYLSRSLEKGLLDARIPYIIYGGIRFYERQEVKDALCYLRMVAGADDLALMRILNKPRRGIGNKTMDAIADEARKSHVSMYEVLKRNEIFSGKAKKTIEGFVNMIETWRADAAGGMEVFRLFEKIIDESGYRAMLEENKETERIENLKELIDDVREFAEDYPESSLDEYLQLVALYGDRDETLSSEYVQLMTVHAAKGLEFDTVFISDLNEGIFPNERAMNDSGSRGVEEERRLAYVAFTRARNKLFLCEAGGYSYILQRPRTSSRFIREIDPEYIEHLGADARRFNSDVQLSPLLFEEKQTTFSQRMHDSPVSQLKKGEMVTHAKFGDGVVISCKNGIAEIAFPYPHGVKKIAAGHPSLKKKAQMRS
ncbi:MAG: UvrD-helicase domain-containing protein [Erysipelotrichaceae bacterium]|jgi:DNA helicase-2/ATP-dependent DNA helicase PcrA|nr:UvrD-helicase domain-containing protein [Erysipelotrichaceae bacterium]